MTIAARSQTTLAAPVALAGRGYWSGAEVRVEFRPAAIDSGVTFVRDDLAPAARIPLAAAMQRPTPRRTILAAASSVGEDASAAATVEMVEHIAAALAGLGVDNCDVGVTASEMPGVDGSSLAFVGAIESVGLVSQDAEVHPLVVTEPVRCERGSTWIEARPPTGDALTIEYNLDFGPGSAIPPQWMVVDVDPMSFRAELAPARTFLLKSEADAIQAQGLASHVSTADLLIFEDGVEGRVGQPIDNPLRYPDECVRHKTLDVVGDLALAGRPVIGRVVACRSGHQLNADLVRELLAIEARAGNHEGKRRSA